MYNLYVTYATKRQGSQVYESISLSEAKKIMDRKMTDHLSGAEDPFVSFQIIRKKEN